MIWPVILATIIVIHLLAELIIVAAYYYKFQDLADGNNQSRGILPSISILVAARNEQDNISSCLQALIAQDYPQDKIEILVGDDLSTDDTFKLAKDFAQGHNHIKVFQITEQLGNAVAKANVLATLVHQATGELLMITDADVVVPPSWVRAMVQSQGNADMVCGVTATARNSLWEELQAIEWLQALSRIKVLADTGLSLTASGNNLLVSVEAYKKTGGFENMKPTITEDFDLLRAVKGSGGEVIFLFHPTVLAITLPKSNWGSLLNQRKRWLGAVFRGNPLIFLFLIIQLLFYPAVIAMLWTNPIASLVALVVKLTIHRLQIMALSSRLGIRSRMLAISTFHLYQFVLYLSSLIYYLLPIKVNWKGRHY